MSVGEPDRPPAPDWGVGHYESTAAQLLPAAHVVVETAGLKAGERVLDLGCGTGNAALVAAELGADVVGVDPAPRLLDVARRRGRETGMKVTFQLGEAARLPIDDSTVDAVVSVFGVIFAPDPAAAAAEMARVLAPEGRIVLSSWLPVGAIHEMNAAAVEAIRQAMGAPAPPGPFAWHDREALEGLLRPFGFTVDIREHELAFTATSAQDFLDTESRNHPLAVAGVALLERLGTAETVRMRLLKILESGNEVTEGFRVTSRYVVATARRG
jgi:ubiquinone/menaquinone biosynthesis C-methylase UbiE